MLDDARFGDLRINIRDPAEQAGIRHELQDSRLRVNPVLQGEHSCVGEENRPELLDDFVQIVTLDGKDDEIGLWQIAGIAAGDRVNREGLVHAMDGQALLLDRGERPGAQQERAVRPGLHQAGPEVAPHRSCSDHQDFHLTHTPPRQPIPSCPNPPVAARRSLAVLPLAHERQYIAQALDRHHIRWDCLPAMTVQQHSSEACRSGGPRIIPQAVPDVQRLPCRHAVLLQRALEDREGRFGGAGETRDRHALEETVDAQTNEDLIESRVKVRHDAEFDFPRLQAGKGRHGVLVQFPGVRPSKIGKHLVEVLVEPLEHPCPVEDVVYNVEPPEPLACLNLLRVLHGEHGRRGGLERLNESLLNRVTVGRDAVLAGQAEVHLADRSFHVKEGVGRVEEDDSRRHHPAHALRPRRSRIDTTTTMIVAWSRRNSASTVRAFRRTTPASPRAMLNRKMMNTVSVRLPKTRSRRWCMWSFPTYSKYSFTVLTFPR